MLRQALAWFDIRRLATAILFVALLAMAVRVPVDSDTWWHLRAGQMTLESGRILQTDLFSHTRGGTPWVNHSWLSQVLLYWLFDHFSYAGLGLWMGTVVALAFVFVYLQMEGDPYSKAFIVVLAAATSSLIWIARPQLLSFLLTAVTAYILYLFKWRRANRLWLLPPLFVLWVNLHAGYALGLMLILAFVVGEVFNHAWEWLAGEPGRRVAREQGSSAATLLPCDSAPLLSWRDLALLVGVALVSVLALALNPNTTRMWTYFLDTVRIGVLQDFIQEWRSPDFHPLSTQPFIWLLLATLAAMGLSGRRADGTDLAIVGMFAYASLLAGRNFGPFALLTAPVLSRHVAAILQRLGLALRPRPRLDRRTRTLMGALNLWLLLITLALAVFKVTTPLSAAFNQAQQRESMPVGAVDWIEAERPSGRMFNHYNWGGYLIWRLWPDYTVFVDGRTDLYGDDLLLDYVRIQSGSPQALSLLAQYDVSFVLTGAGDALSLALSCSDEWTEAYRDTLSTVWLRSGSPTADE